MNDGFYRYRNGLQYAPTFVSNPQYDIHKTLKDTYTYPIDGWYWFDTYDEAIKYFNIQNVITKDIDVNKINVWTSYEFFKRFSVDEQDKIVEISNVDPIIKKFLFMLGMATEVQNNNIDTISGMEYLVILGIISEQRKNEILYL